MNKFSLNQIVKGKVCGYFVVLAYRQLNGRTFVQVKPYDPKTGQTSYGEMAFEEDMLTEYDSQKPHVEWHGYNSFYGEVVSVLNDGSVISVDGFVIDRISDQTNLIKFQNVMAGF